MKTRFIPLIAIVLLASCESGGTNTIERKTGKAISTISADSDLSPEEREKMEKDFQLEQKKRKALEASWTSLKFDKEVHDFGKVKADTDCFADVRVINTGDKPLIVSNVYASCGCTMPRRPKGPIAPGQSDIIQVKFHSKPGQLNEVTKTVTVEANTKQGKHTFDIRAFVEE